MSRTPAIHEADEGELDRPHRAPWTGATGDEEPWLDEEPIVFMDEDWPGQFGAARLGIP